VETAFPQFGFAAKSIGRPQNGLDNCRRRGFVREQIYGKEDVDVVCGPRLGQLAEEAFRRALGEVLTLGEKAEAASDDEADAMIAKFIEQVQQAPGYAERRRGPSLLDLTSPPVNPLGMNPK
jgi:hypothetical protein